MLTFKSEMPTIFNKCLLKAGATYFFVLGQWEELFHAGQSISW